MKKIIVFILVNLVIILQYRLWLSSDGILITHQLKQKLIEQQLKNDELVEQNNQLQKEIDFMKAEENKLIENQVRDELGMIKKGEIYYHVVK